ncbi:MAG: hypothetical protein Q9219_000829 [cf. Caloplaca sp. 3 TL-2023]
MDISQAASRLLSDQVSLEGLAPDVVAILRSGSNKQYLDTLARIALQSSHTSTIFTHHHGLSIDIASRWLNDPTFNSCTVAVFAALARILPGAPYLSPYIERIIQLRSNGPLSILTSHTLAAVYDISDDVLQDVLLALCRLLNFDNEAFAHLVTPAQLQLLLRHTNRTVRYLAVKNFCLYLHASEATLEEMIDKYLGQEPIHGLWDSKTIDYTFLSLWEDKRLQDMQQNLMHARQAQTVVESGAGTRRIIVKQDLSPGTVCLEGVLLPHPDFQLPRPSSLVVTHTVSKNIASFAEAIKSNDPVLLNGPIGAGKTLLIRDIARQLGHDERMITLHLNEQTDAKLLIGLYTTAGGPGSFTWTPGILTKAVTEGRWVLIEDFDRAPAETISTLLPLLERRELLIPHWGRTIRAAPGFKLIATVRSHDGMANSVRARRSVIGMRHWNHVNILALPENELGEIVLQRFPLLHAYLSRLMGLYSRLREMTMNSQLQGKISSRGCSPSDLFRWTSRINNLLNAIGGTTGTEPIPGTADDNIFLEAVDCFAGGLPGGDQKRRVVALIAQELLVSPERVNFCMDFRVPEYRKADSILRIGRTSLSRKRIRASRSSSRSKPDTFATTNLVLGQLESVAVAIRMAEPCLLVGETGTGKTTLVQQLAESLNHKLVVINLSQQSESGDLLGGFKPVDIRTLAIPIKEEFEDLFESTFSSARNQRYIEHVAKAISKNRWLRTLTLWREAAKMVGSTFTSQEISAQQTPKEPSIKKRKVDSHRLQVLKTRWNDFVGQLDTFQKHLESGSKGFAFSFIEGNIVKAARNGDWVLLDEINLATSDTLESIADLLAHSNDDHPSLLLTETGETERVQAHKDFRIFGAMNPANDIGKRDLPFSFRSRFFELFVESPDRDLNNLVPLIQAYLGSTAYNDVRAADDIARLYLKIQQLVSENRLVDGANQKPHYSLRTLTRILVYVLDIASMYGLRRALFEGFSMSFLTLLDQASSQQVLPLMEEHLLKTQRNVKAMLFQTPKLSYDTEKFVKFKQYWMTKGPHLIRNQDHYIITPFIERNLLNLVRATSSRRFPVLLQGPTSSGKTSMVEYLANISGHKFVRINNHEHTDLQEYLGTYVSRHDGQLVYQEGILVRALREGFWIVLDELNLAPSDVLEALNRLLDDNRELFIPETQQFVRPHDNFMLFATQNPPGIYGGRKILSRAFRNRFLELHFDDIPEDELEVILRERSQIAPSFCAKIVAVYKGLSLHRQHSRLFEQKNSFATLRDLFRWAFRGADDREQLAIHGYYLLAERVRDDGERQVVKNIIEEVMKTKIDEDKLYGRQRLPASLGIDPTAGGIVWTKSMRRLYVLVTEALENREPVLLVGDTGSGKTSICQVIAEVMHTRLHIVNAHQNMETGDLIGSQRPVRSRHSIEARLHLELHKVLSRLQGTETTGRVNLRELIESYRGLPQAVSATLPLQTRKDLDEYLAQSRALFEWVDGSLVHAMKNGQHFLLDEISLADDSVLERLNSVLEPSRTLFLAEKGVNDALVVAAEGFQFLATMNPGGDYGKKELSPALRNRFTEIWVPHASDQQEIEEIIEVKLGQSQAYLAGPMVAFAEWYGSNLGNTAPRISVRDLLAWVAFLKSDCVADVHRSILHGAALVYIDALGANPAAKLQLVGSSIEEQRKLCLDKLSKLFHHDMTRMYWEVIQLRIDDQKITLGPFCLTRHASAFPDPAYSLHAPTTLRNAMKIARALQLPRPVLVEGNPGVGKTTLVGALAQACGMPLTRINLSDQTDLTDLFGSDVPVEGGVAGQFQWRDAPFLRAMQNGEWVLLDEMNLASQSVLEGLNACFDHRGQIYVSELDQTFTRHPNFVVFAAQNPHHQGSGRKGLPASFVNRFTVVYADTFSADDLQIICSERFPDVPVEDVKRLTHCVADLDAAVQQDRRVGMKGGPWEINLRDTTRWLDLGSSQSSLLCAARAEDYAAMLFLQRFRTSEDLTVLLSLLRPHLPGPVGSQHRVIGVSAYHVQVGMGLLTRQTPSFLTSKNHISPQSHIPYVESVLLCIQKGWPCLLVGPSGSGKKEMVRHLASCSGANLVEFSLNADMDAADLLGGYEQVDIQRSHVAFLARLKQFVGDTRLQQLRQMQEEPGFLTELETLLSTRHTSLEKVIQLLRDVTHEVSSTGFDTYLREGEAVMSEASHDHRARFGWVDGILIRAVVEGKWLMLDNANLCSPSVLDRLNSLLEPNGVLHINEHRSEDGSARVVKPHPDFRLFMTMDPQHGELSRAMRNRNIELFIPVPENEGLDYGISLTFDPSMIRFRQSIQPLNNPVLLDLEHKMDASDHLRRLGLYLDLLIRVIRLEDRFNSIADNDKVESPLQPSRLRRSLVRAQLRHVGETSDSHLAPFLADSIKCLRSALEQTDFTEVGKLIDHQPEQTTISGFEQCFMYLSDLIDVTHSIEVDEAEFRVYLSLGKDLIAVLRSGGEASRLADAMQSGMSNIATSRQLKSGQSMDRIWRRIRPQTPVTIEELERKLLFEQVAKRFDKLTWASGMPVHTLSEMRQKITQMGDMTAAMIQNISHNTKEINDALGEMEARQDVLGESGSPFLQAEFEALCQYQAASALVDDDETQNVLSLLAGRPTRQAEHRTVSIDWRVLSKATRIAGVDGTEIEFAVLRSSFPIRVLQKLGNVAEVPLRSLDLLRDEIVQMASSAVKLTAAMSKDHRSVIVDFLRQLQGKLADAHQDYLQAAISAGDSELDSASAIWLLREGIPSSHYFRSIVENDLQPSWDFIVGHDDQYSLPNLASAWILLFTACLKLYIPDRPHDPALKPRVVRDRHLKHKRGLENRLAALQHFERVTSGQTTNLRCQLLEEELRAMGQEPAVDPVLRPVASELNQLQGVFDNVLRSVVERVPKLTELNRLFSGDSLVMEEIKVLRFNITQAVAHLRQSFRMYEDMTKPLVTMLLGLGAGLAVTEIAVADQTEVASTLEYICRSTPFFGMSPAVPLQESLHDFQSVQEDRYDSRLKYLETYAVMNSMSRSFQPATLSELFRVVHNVYTDWKTQLGEDQRRDLAKSSIYRYRGVEADAGANEEEEFHELFPDAETADVRTTNRDKMRLDPGELAQRLAHFQRQLLESDMSPMDRILDLIRSRSADIGRVWQNQSPTIANPLPSRSFLCGLVLKLVEESDRLDEVPPAPIAKNFYTDSNLREARKLVGLVRQLQARFFELKQAWPEHSTLDDVLRTSSELLGLRHTEPVGRLITKVEKLHGYVQEWQTVASREYSASILFEHLTSLIVEWRRLELATWSRLFDMEDDRCEREVDSWWFVAYEAIVAAPVSLLESGDGLQEHAEELFITLQGFLTNTAMGHFRLRMRLLETFESYIELIQQTLPGLETVCHTLSNFIAFYRRYTAPIQEKLHTGRLALEKEMKDVILMASWKDTNVHALRESAKRSHHKLFKVVRKYRTLLAQPTQPIIDGGFPDYVDTPTALVASLDHRDPFSSNPVPVMPNPPYNWSERPLRFRNVSNTLANMVKMSQLNLSVTRIPSVLENYAYNLLEDVKVLGKETPTVATDDSMDLLKHLTTRKRKLFSDTLKTIRHMGFRTNLNGDALARQASLAVTLSRILPIRNVAPANGFSASEYHLYRILNFMPAVRESLRVHSEDLNGPEVSRSVGYLESILSYVIKERVLAGDLGKDLMNLDQTVQKMQNVWKPDEYRVVPQRLEGNAIHNIQHTVSCLTHIISAGCFLVEKHGELVGVKHADIHKLLQEWTKKFRKLSALFEKEPILPHMITYAQSYSRYTDAVSLIESFKHDLYEQVKEHTDLAFVLEQIALWAGTSPGSNGCIAQNTSLSVEEFDRNLMKTCDTILVAIQSFENTMSALPSTEDQNWLVRSGKAMADGVKVLHVREMSKSIEDTMAGLCCLTPEGLEQASALVALMLPIVKQYRDICHRVFEHLAARSTSLNRMAAMLAEQFSQLASRGFCNPAKSGPSEGSKNEKLEEGTGLGEGEGAEDISKDIQDDEDLSELAQEGQKGKDGEEIPDQEDAVNMDQDELEGELGDAPERDGDGDEASEAGSGNDEIDEETGDVDDLDPNAVDEKLWDDDQRHSEKEKQGSKPKGPSKKDEQPDPASDQQNHDEGMEAEEVSDAGADEIEEVAPGEADMMDPCAPEEGNLDLPDQMDLDGQEKLSGKSDMEDSDLDGLSDADVEENHESKDTASESELEGEGSSEEDRQPQNIEDGTETEDLNMDKAEEEAASPVDTDPDQDFSDDDGLLQTHTEDANVDKDHIAPSDAQGLDGQDANENENPETQDSEAAGSNGVASEQAAAERSHTPAHKGELGNLPDRPKDTPESHDPAYETPTNQAFKKLGDALEKWHRQQRQIQDAQLSSPGPEQNAADIDMTDPEFQHLEDEEAQADTQALGAATEDQARTLDQRALDSEMQDQPSDDLLPTKVEDIHEEDIIMEEVDEEEKEDTHPPEMTNEKSKKEPSHPTAFISTDPPKKHSPTPSPQNSTPPSPSPSLPPSSDLPPSSQFPRSLSSARALWSHHARTTHPLSLLLSSQLRLTLPATLATKLRGDFRTGKRLNLKRIIPYIASQYRRDKIWLRRSQPQKRAYQILLAIDDSRSMGEGGKGDLAFKTLALVAGALEMLEVGEVGVVGFGEGVFVAHELGERWSGEAGAEVVRRFGFRQGRTDVVGLLERSLEVFREGRRRASGVGDETWQLEFIVSDGVLVGGEERKGEVRRLVRRMEEEERVLCVFVVVDGGGGGGGSSVMDVKEAVWEEGGVAGGMGGRGMAGGMGGGGVGDGSAGEGIGEGEKKLVVKRYMDSFPFSYYVIVGDVSELPAVLGKALQGWFAEVVGRG